MTTRQIVEANKELFLSAKTSEELKKLFGQFGLATQHRWTKAVAAVIEIGGLDYYAARGEQRAATMEQLRAAVTHEVTLHVDAKARNYGHFAICDGAGELLTHGKIFENWFRYGDVTEQSACECAAARMAIKLAADIKSAAGLAAIKLNLIVDAQWLTTLSGKASVLASDARRHNIELNMEWIAGTSNPADKFTIISGYQKIESDLAVLATPVLKLDPNKIAAAEESTAAVADIFENLETQAAPAIAEKTPEQIAEMQAKRGWGSTVKAARESREAEELVGRRENEISMIEKNTGRLLAGMRFGCEKKINTLHQFENCILSLNRDRAVVGLPELSAAEIEQFQKIQNFNELVSVAK